MTDAPTPASRCKLVSRVADHLVAHRPNHPLRVAVDGVTASGKTTFADELAAAVEARSRATIRLSMDGFHHHRARRYRQGRNSAIGYYEDAYDFESFARAVLDPLGPAGDGRYLARTIDLASDQLVDEEPQRSPHDAVLLVDGSFLQSAALANRWDEVVFVDTDLHVARDRGVQRDADAFGGAEQAGAAFDARYHAACRIYLARIDPVSQASIVVINDDLSCPTLRRIGGRPADTVQLFSYGTLQQRDVQRSIFGREVDGVADRLPGHRSDWVTLTDDDGIVASGSDRHPIVRPTGNPADVVAGTVFTITTADLAAADGYEVEEYRRVLVRLSSGLESWVYLANA